MTSTVFTNEYSYKSYRGCTFHKEVALVDYKTPAVVYDRLRPYWPGIKSLCFIA